VAKKRSGDQGASRKNGGAKAQELTRLAEVAADHRAAASDQTASDADQTASDADQTASDRDGELSVRDQQVSGRDQRASDRDQAVSDLELSMHPGGDAQTAHDANLAERRAGTAVRQKTGEVRAVAAENRARVAERRDETAWHRDVTAQARDGAAERRDRESAKIERKMASRATALRTALTHAFEIRAQAATDRARAAEDRAQAAADRKRAAEERDATLAELQRAHRDELTGAFRRGAGEEALRDEIERARRGDDDRLVLAFVDVDNLREVNNRDGHSAGDALLREVVSVIRSKMRSYEPIVRFGGDEFVCAVAGLDFEQAERRFSDVQSSLAESTNGAAVSVGLAELRDEDSLPDLIERADVALLEFRRKRLNGAD
jgi:diguanylate cyclase (GGDEF)-like protein